MNETIKMKMGHRPSRIPPGTSSSVWPDQELSGCI